MQRYQYDGPVVQFDRCIQYRWKADTFACSEAKAKSNLAYRYKQEKGLKSNAKIALPAKMTLV